MKKIELKLIREPIWPNCCAYCCGESATTVKGKSSIISGINPLFYTRRFITFNYPVCKNHIFYGRFLSFFMHQSTVDLFVGSLFIPLLVFLPIIFIPAIKSEWQNYIFISIYALYLIGVIYLKLKMPIKFGRKVNKKVKIRFSNEKYADLFEKENS